MFDNDEQHKKEAFDPTNNTIKCKIVSGPAGDPPGDRFDEGQVSRAIWDDTDNCYRIVIIEP